VGWPDPPPASRKYRKKSIWGRKKSAAKVVASECAKKTPSYAENEIGEKNNEEGIDLNKQ
jgi:hypothetical protein